MSQSNEALWNLVKYAFSKSTPENVEDLSKLVINMLPETYEPEPNYISEDELVL